MAITKTPRLNQTRWSSGQDEVQRTDFDSDAASLEAVVAMYKQGTLAARPAAGVEGRFYTVKDDPVTSRNGRQYYDNGTSWAPATKYATDLVVENELNTNPSLIVKGGSSATTDIMRVTDNSDNIITRVSAGKQFHVGNSIFSNETVGGVAAVIQGVASGQKALEVRSRPAGAASTIFSVHQGDTTSPIFNVDSSGVAKVTGQFLVDGSITANTITASSLQGSATAILSTTTIRPENANQTALTVGTQVSQVNNIINLTRYLGPGNDVQYARFTSGGDFATNARVNIGTGQGTGVSGVLSATTPAFVVQNNVSASVPAARVVAHGSQTGNVLEVLNGAGTSIFSVNKDGVASAASNVLAANVYVGGSTGATVVDGQAPRLEVLTGTATGTFNEHVVLRHGSVPTTTAAYRRVSLTFKMTANEIGPNANKSASISLLSTEGSGNNPVLQFNLAGNELGVFNADGDLRLNNKLIVNDPLIQMRENLLYVGGGSWGEWSDIAPRSPLNNDVWMDTTTNSLKYAFAAGEWATLASADIDVTQVGGQVMETIGNGWSGVTAAEQEGLRSGNTYQVTLYIQRTGGTITANSRGNFTDSVNQVCSLQGMWKPHRQNNSFTGTIDGDETLGCSLRVNANGAVILQSAAPNLAIKNGDTIKITGIFLKPGALVS